MNWLEKARKEYPGWTDEEIMNSVCPLDYDAGLCPDNGARQLYCDECWAREVPPDWTDKPFRPHLHMAENPKEE